MNMYTEVSFVIIVGFLVLFAIQEIRIYEIRRRNSMIAMELIEGQETMKYLEHKSRNKDDLIKERDNLELERKEIEREKNHMASSIDSSKNKISLSCSNFENDSDTMKKCCENIVDDRMNDIHELYEREYRNWEALLDVNFDIKKINA